MPETNTEEKVKQESQTEGAQEGAEEKSAERMVPQSTLNRLTSKWQTENARLNKEKGGAERRVQELERETAELRQQVEDAPLGDDEEAKRLRRQLKQTQAELTQRQTEVDQKEQALSINERLFEIKRLHTETGVPVEEIEDLPVREMRLRAREWAVEQKEKQPATRAKPKPTEAGEQRLPSADVRGMSDKEFDAHWNRLQRQARRKQRE